MLSPIVDEIAEEVTDKKVGKINVDEQPGLAAEFNVMSIPTLILFKDGKEVKRTMGVQPKPLVKKMLEG
jgi:thioredoxin 1